jgi:predicted TPR repeat methyltransferase
MTKYQQIAVRIPDSSRVLDVGCGVGILGYYLNGKQCDVTGWDLKLENTSDYEKYYTSMGELMLRKRDLGKKNTMLWFFPMCWSICMKPARCYGKAEKI